MKANTAEQDALIRIMMGIYSEICNVEENLGILVDEQDFRPRIEYFHDAVRLISSGVVDSLRLSVEFLSYDVALLRHIVANPLAKKPGTSPNLSPGTQVSVHAMPENLAGASRATLKNTLSEAYKKYSILYVALFAYHADKDYKNKVEECNTEVEEVAGLIPILKKQGQANVDMEALMLHYMDDPELIQKLTVLLGKNSKKMQAAQALQALQQVMKQSDERLKNIETAHFKYVTNQLAIYENSRDIVKKMAAGGLNIVGKFVEDAIRSAGLGDRGR